MKNFCLIVFILLIFQDLIAQFQIIDSITKKPIPFVIVTLTNKNIGTYSNEDGYFTFNELIKDDSLNFKHIGYTEKKITNSEISNNEPIILSPRIIELKEVLISNKIKKDFEIGHLTLKSDASFGVTGIGDEIATLIEAPLQQGKIVKSLVFKIKKKKTNSLVRVHVYTSKNGKPGDEIYIRDNLIVIDNKVKDIFSVDVIKNQIIFPKEGLFVSIEFIGEISDNNRWRKDSRIISPLVKVKFVNIDKKNNYMMRFWGKDWFWSENSFKKMDMQPLFGLILEL
jgi:hypothetical protein